MASLSVEVVTGDRVVYSEEGVDMVVAPGSAGMLGILPNHAPLITTLSAGELRVKKGAQEQVDGGVRWFHGSDAGQSRRSG